MSMNNAATVAAKKNKQLIQIIEGAIFAAGKPLSVEELRKTVLAEFDLSSRKINNLIRELQQDYEGRGIELVKVNTGYRFQTIPMLSPWISLLYEERAPRYSRALLETLSIIAYRQPTTRGEIERVRGVAVSSNIIRTLQERNWVKVIGHKEVPGRPAIFATTPAFLDYFGLESLDQLPQLQEFKTTPLLESDSGESDVRKTSESPSESG